MVNLDTDYNLFLY